MTKKSKAILYSGLAVILILLLSLYLNFSPKEFNFFPKCMFHSLTGLHCPGCGSQRAIHAILNGQIIEGLKYNLLIILAIFVLSYQIVQQIIVYFYPEKNNNILYKSATPWVIFIIIILFWILRNIPFAPFTFLAP